MVPPSLREKWPRDFETFKTRCLKRPEDRANGLRAQFAKNGIDFFRLLDDPVRRRPHIIFLTHGAFHVALNDPWVKLAILRTALRPASLASQRSVFPRFAAEILRRKSRHVDERLFERLFSRSFGFWRDTITKFEQDPGDDPIPRAIARVLKHRRVNLSELRAHLAKLPMRRSQHVEERLLGLRRALNTAIQDVWKRALAQARFRSPLLVMDEAHHLKNPSTRLASLFVPEGEGDARLLDGALNGGFERMLFLTATPFQLGHHELLSVLDRFRDIRWKQREPAGMTVDRFDQTMRQLAQVLDAAHRATSQLDKRWDKLEPEEIGLSNSSDGQAEHWWQTVRSEPDRQPERVQIVWRTYTRACKAMEVAGQALAPWVIRHTRSRRFPESEVERRRVLRGSAIAGDDRGSLQGLTIRDESILPFLLAARSQAVVAYGLQRNADVVVRRATFAEGLASSYEAFLDTRAATLSNDGSGTGTDEDVELPMWRPGTAAARGTVSWYLDHLRRALPHDDAYVRHPKIAPTIEKAQSLWEHGEKVLIFCHYRATGTGLARHLSSTLARRVRSIGAATLSCSELEVEKRLELIGDRFEKGRPLHRELGKTVGQLVAQQSSLSEEDVHRILDVARRFVRTPAFLVRYFPLNATDINRAFRDAIREPDGSGLSLHDKLRGFVDFLANRCEPDLRAEYLDALSEIRTGVRHGGRRPGTDKSVGFELAPSVRRATGLDKREERRRALLGFNSPFFPEILVASSVLAEGVDLHLDCRHVIHHDLCWNPSTLEQRTGRVDRIGAKAERVRQPIEVYLPFLAETQDEKMYRVVQDRERWFQVLMGEEYKVDEQWADRVAKRVPLPQSAAAELAFRLEVHKRSPGGAS